MFQTSFISSFTLVVFWPSTNELDGKIPSIEVLEHRRRFLLADPRGERRDGQVRDLGHGGAGAVPQPRAHVLPWRRRRGRRLRHHQRG